MIVVVVIGVLSAVAVMAYGKYWVRARKSEVVALLGEMKSREEAYRMEFGEYLATGTSENDLCPAFTSGEPVAKSTDPCFTDKNWGQTGLGMTQAYYRQIYCGAVARAGITPTSSPSGALAARLYATPPPSNPPTPWYYAVAKCDFDGRGAPYSTYVVMFDAPGVYEENIGK